MFQAIRFYLYFIRWGLWYGTMFCVLIGTAFHPGAGALSALYGPLIGIGTWLFSAFIVSFYHATHFSPDIDLAVYRRRVARRVVLWAAGLVVLFLVLAFMATSSADRFLPGALVVILFASPFFLWICCAMAYTAHQYPLWFVGQMNTGNDLPHPMPSIAEARNRLLGSIYHRLLFMFIGLPAAFAYLYYITSAQYLFPSPESTALLYFSFALVASLFIFYCAQGNATLITFIKVLILEDYFPNMSLHRHRVILTMISFLYTLVTTWWTLILAPLYAVFIAYHVYHTLALPHDGTDKAKRKEKISEELVNSEGEPA